MKSINRVLFVLIFISLGCDIHKSNDTQNENNYNKESNLSEKEEGEPTIIITDLYYPPQDDDDNFDLVMAYALPEIKTRAIILDITEAFRKPVADHPVLWKDPFGPREAGIIPVMQLNYIFNKNIPFAVSPLNAMRSTRDKMYDIPEFQQQGVELLLSVLKESTEKVHILSFGSARVLAVAYNRDSALMKEKVKMIYLNMGMVYREGATLDEIDSRKSEVDSWNVNLDVHSFVRLMRSDLPIALYPCGSWEGTGKNNTFWELKSLTFITEMNKKLQRYMDYLFRKKNQYDFLRAMDLNELPDTSIIENQYPREFYMWTTESWLQVANLVLTGKGDTVFSIKSTDDVEDDEVIVSGKLLPCVFEVGNDGTFAFTKISASEATNFYIYERSNPILNLEAFNVALPAFFKSFDPDNNHP